MKEIHAEVSAKNGMHRILVDGKPVRSAYGLAAAPYAFMQIVEVDGQKYMSITGYFDGLLESGLYKLERIGGLETVNEPFTT